MAINVTKWTFRVFHRITEFFLNNSENMQATPCGITVKHTNINSIIYWFKLDVALICSTNLRAWPFLDFTSFFKKKNSV